MKPEKIVTACSYALAAAVMGIWIYFLPLLFIGFVLGIAIGTNIDKVKKWIEDSDDPYESM